MSSGERMPLAEAQALAESLRDLLSASCVRLEIAGSVRRRRETIGDLELVAVPKMRPGPQAGLFGGGREESVLWAKLDELVADPDGGLKRPPPMMVACGHCGGGGMLLGPEDCPKCKNRLLVPRAAPWGDRYRQLLWLDRPVDLFTADSDSWGAQLLIRTGPPEYSQAWVTALRGAGLVMRGGWVRSLDTDAIVPVPDEETAHALVGWPMVLPEGREAWRGTKSWSDNPSLSGR